MSELMRMKVIRFRIRKLREYLFFEYRISNKDLRIQKFDDTSQS